MNQYEIVAQAGRLAQLARANGLVLTISQQSLLPLAMGNHADLCEVRPLRGAPEPAPCAMTDALMWLESALNCKEFVWDADQHEMASMALHAAREMVSR